MLQCDQTPASPPTQNWNRYCLIFPSNSARYSSVWFIVMKINFLIKHCRDCQSLCDLNLVLQCLNFLFYFSHKTLFSQNDVEITIMRDQRSASDQKRKRKMGWITYKPDGLKEQTWLDSFCLIIFIDQSASLYEIRLARCTAEVNLHF